MVNEAIAYLDTQVKEKTYLGPDGTFVTDKKLVCNDEKQDI